MVTHIEINILPIQSANGYHQFTEKIVINIKGNLRMFAVADLLPQTEYTLYMIAYNEDGMSNLSDILTFKTLQGKLNIYLFHNSH